MVKLFILLLLISFPFGQLTRLPFNRGEWNFYFHDLVIITLLLYWLGKKFLQKEKFYWPSLTQAILGFIISAGFSLLLAFPYFKTSELLVASLYLFRWVAYSGIYFVLFDAIKHKALVIPSLAKAKPGAGNYQPLIIAGVLVAFFGLLQYIFMPDLRPLAKFDWDPHYYRVVGTFLDPGFTGLIYVLTLILIITPLFQLGLTKNWISRNLSTGRGLRILAGVMVYLALALTYSRSAYLAYLVAMALIAWYKKSVKFFLAVLGVGIITVLLLPRPGGEGVRLERKSTIRARIDNWQQSLVIGFKKPLFGWGFNTYRYVQKNLGLLDEENWQKSHAAAGADSSLLFVWATTGLIGLISFLCLGIKIFKQNRSSIVAVSSLAAVLIHSFFNNSLFYAWVMIWMWILLAIGSKSQITNHKSQT